MFIMISVSGCYSLWVDSAVSDYGIRYKPLVNKVNKEYIRRTTGKPRNVTVVNGNEEWHYWFLKSGDTKVQSSYEYTQTAEAKWNNEAKYDYLTLTFDATDTLRAWNVIVTTADYR